MGFSNNGLIESLDPGEIFVFGSNLAGRHGAGAALQARRYFGAQYGIGEGLTGKCYAFPTLDENLNAISLDHLILARNRFFSTAQQRYDLTFLLTKVGCGLAGFPEPFMRSVFNGFPKNVILPEDWR